MELCLIPTNPKKCIYLQFCLPITSHGPDFCLIIYHQTIYHFEAQFNCLVKKSPLYGVLKFHTSISSPPAFRLKSNQSSTLKQVSQHSFSFSLFRDSLFVLESRRGGQNDHLFAALLFQVEGEVRTDVYSLLD